MEKAKGAQEKAKEDMVRGEPSGPVKRDSGRVIRPRVQGKQQGRELGKVRSQAAATIVAEMDTWRETAPIWGKVSRASVPTAEEKDIEQLSAQQAKEGQERTEVC